MPTKTKRATGQKSAQNTHSRAKGAGGHRLSTAFAEVERLPALADSKRVLDRLLGNPNPAEGELVDAIESDLALTLAVMRSANNGHGSGRGSVSAITQAVEVIGPSGLIEVTEDTPTYEMFEPANGWRRLPDRFRSHAIATRTAIERIGEVARLPGHDELSVAALIHDVGKLVMALLHPGYEQPGVVESTVPEDRVRAELRDLGIEHALVGGVLARRWGFPDRIARAVERHHAPDSRGAAAAVRLADLVAHHAHGGAISATAVKQASEALDLKPAQVRKLFYEYPYPHRERRRVSDPCPLSARELDALRGLAEGKVYKEIAREMSLSASTVRTHLHNVYRKIGAVDRAQAVLVAHERGWI